MKNFINNNIIFPIKAIKKSYLPILSIYFGAGFLGITSVAYTFFVKDSLTLSAAQLAQASIWMTLPWSIKFLFGTIIDSWKVFGSNRKFYIILGGILTSLSAILWADLASTKFLESYFSQYLVFVFSGFLMNLGVVLQDITADTMAVEVAEAKEDIGIVQVLSRLFFQFGALGAAFLTGYLAENFSTATVFLMRIGVIGLTFTGLFAAKCPKVETAPINKKCLYSSLAYVSYLLICILGLNSILDEPVFLLKESLLFLGGATLIYYLMKDIVLKLDPKIRTDFVYACVGIFFFRCVPYAGEGVGWWLIDSVGMTPQDFATLRQISFVVSTIVLWGFSSVIANSSIKKTLLILAGLDIAFQIPEIATFYGLNESIGVSAKSMIFITTVLTSPVGGLSMIPLGILIANHAPSNQKALYFSVTASLMNLSLQVGSMITIVMNKFNVVTRTDFSELGQIMLLVLIFSVILPGIGIKIIRENK